MRKPPTSLSASVIPTQDFPTMVSRGICPSNGTAPQQGGGNPSSSLMLPSSAVPRRTVRIAESPVYATPRTSGPTPVNGEQWQFVSQRLANRLATGSFTSSPAMSPTSTSFGTPKSTVAPTPVVIENWQAVGQRMARMFQDTSPTNTTLSSPTTTASHRLLSCSPAASPMASPQRSPAMQVHMLGSSSTTSRSNYPSGGMLAAQLMYSYG